MKRKLFIGSSSESLVIARQTKEIIEKACGDWLECIIWDEGKVFSHNTSFIDSLVKASRRYDYGILIASSDDITYMRRWFKLKPRDNVVFEMGLFLGSLGLTRAFLFADKKANLPSDYNGISIPTFSSKKISIRNLQGVIDQLNSTKITYALKPMPSVALALGYYDSFVAQIIRSKSHENFKFEILLPMNLDEINNQRANYKLANPSEEISIYDDGSRPIICRLINDNLKYWDIPSTLSTLNKLINYIVPTNEIGLSPDRKEWIEYELRNFKGTLEVLISDNPLSKGKITVEWL
jgi:hypothetical protein